LEDIDPDPYPDILSVLAEQFFTGFPVEALYSLIALVVLIVFSALVSGSETAFFSLKPADIEAMRSSIHKKDKLVLQLRLRPKRLLATILISNNFVNVAIVMVSTYLTSLIFNLEGFPLLAFVIQVVVITSVILIFGEIIPKIFANKEPVMLSNLMVKPLNFLLKFFYPLSILLVRSISLIDKKINVKGQNITVSELSDAIEMTVDDSVPEDEKMILKGIASFIDMEASEIMQSRVNVTAVDIKDPFASVMEVVISSGYSRIPVYEETFDKVKGILYIKDLLPFLDVKEKKDWHKLIRLPFFVPENKRINDLLQEFREKKIHLAIVVDEYGGTSGIITLEDIIEEIVGEISDEFDIEDSHFSYRRISPKRFVFEAKTPLIDLCKILDVEDEVFDEVRGESDSLGGLILELEGNIPEKGTVVIFDNFTFTITDATERMIKEVEVKMDNPKTDKA
jgi:putative hemolysin